MKLAEALQERADIQKKISELCSRIIDNIHVQEGERTNEDPNAMLEELIARKERLEVLICQINKSNNVLKIEGKTLTEVIAKKEKLEHLTKKYREIINDAALPSHRIRCTEVKFLTTVNVKELRKQSETVAKELRIIDNKLQKANWTYDLIED